MIYTLRKCKASPYIFNLYLTTNNVKNICVIQIKVVSLWCS